MDNILYDAVITSLPGMDKGKPAPGPSFLTCLRIPDVSYNYYNVDLSF